MESSLIIDGSQGEGGGQIVRSSVALSLVTGRSVQIDNIRAGRSKPGLMRQHLTAVRAAVEIGGADVEGADIGSTSLVFHPKTIKPGSYTFSVGTAGSATLVLQTILPALLVADGPAELTLEGGTHNPWAPPYDFLANAIFPLIQRMGVDISTRLERHGFYPAGGGRFTVGIVPAKELQGIDLLERGAVQQRMVTALVAYLSRQIGQREIDTLSKKLNWPKKWFQIHEVAHSHGPGNVVLIEVASENVAEVFTGFGRQGVKAEYIAAEALKQVQAYLATDAPVGPYLADQLMLPMTIASWKSGNGSCFRTLPLTRHSMTHIDILSRFLDVPIRVEQEDATCIVHIGRR
jgi:RNA 3'-terminal phosphate cyclase (ATP)